MVNLVPITCFTFLSGLTIFGAAVIVCRTSVKWLDSRKYCPNLLRRLFLNNSTAKEPWFFRSAFMRCLLLGSATVITIGAAYGFFVEPYRLKIDRVEYRSPKALSPIRIAFFSDTHSDPDPRLEEVLPSQILAAKPDLIVFGGDAANSSEGFPVFKQLMSSSGLLG